MRGQVPPWDGRTGGIGHAYLAVAGGGIGTSAPPGPGPHGAAFTTPAGVFHGRVEGSAYHAAGGDGAMAVYLDGVAVGQSYLYFNAVNTHMMMQPLIFSLSVAAGTHHLWLARSFITTDVTDNWFLSGPILPA